MCSFKTIWQLAFPDAIYLVDAIQGGEMLVKACKPALESSYITKVIHDCKRDSEVSNSFLLAYLGMSYFVILVPILNLFSFSRLCISSLASNWTMLWIHRWACYMFMGYLSCSIVFDKGFHKTLLLEMLWFVNCIC